MGTKVRHLRCPSCGVRWNTTRGRFKLWLLRITVLKCPSCDDLRVWHRELRRKNKEKSPGDHDGRRG